MSHAPAPTIPLSAAQQKLAADNVKLVYKTVSHFGRTSVGQLCRRGWDKEECIAYLMPHYLVAIRLYNPELAELSTYIVVSLRRALRRAVETAREPFCEMSYNQVPTVQDTHDREFREAREHYRELLAPALDVLDERERGAVEMYYMSDDETTYDFIANKYGVCKERVRQILNLSLAKMRVHLEKEGAEI